MYRDGLIAPQIFASYAFDELPRALEDLESRRSRGKLVIRVAEEAGCS